MRGANRRVTLAAGCVTFFGLGLFVATLGPIIPDVSRQTGVTVDAAGAILSALSLGAFLMMFAAGGLVDVFGHRFVIVLGLLCLGAGSTIAAFSQSLGLTLAAIAVAGLGHGGLTIGVNVLIAQTFADKNVAALNLINLFYGVGAVTAPVIASLMLRATGSALPTLWVGAAVMLLLVPMVLLVIAARHTPPTRTEGGSSVLYRVPLLWLLSVLILLYVGIEAGMGGWTTVFVTTTTPLTLETAALVTSGFWLALTGGRLAGTLFGARFTARAVLRASIGVLLVGSVLLFVAIGNTPLTIAAVLLTGFGCGPVFPTVVAIATTAFRHAPGKATSVIVAFANIGGMGLPALQGVLLQRVSPAASASLIALCALAILALFSRIRPRPDTAPVSAISPAEIAHP